MINRLSAVHPDPNFRGIFNTRLPWHGKYRVVEVKEGSALIGASGRSSPLPLAVGAEFEYRPGDNGNRLSVTNCVVDWLGECQPAAEPQPG